MSNESRGRLLQISQGYKSDGIPTFETGEFGLALDEGQEELWVGSKTGNLKVLTEHDISSMTIPDASINKSKLDGELTTIIDSKVSLSDIPNASASQRGLMTSANFNKLNSVESGANFTMIEDNLTSLHTDRALSAYQGKVLKDLLDSGGGGGGSATVIDNLTSTDTTSALSANQGRILKGLVDSKAGTTTATTTSNGLMSASDKQLLISLSNNATVTVVNTLTSTSTTSALSAYQGKVLNETKLSGYQKRVTTHAEGTAFGYETSATGEGSFASGFITVASGNYAVAEGRQTKAIGYYSRASGQETQSYGWASFASGTGTISQNYSSTALGFYSNMTSSNSNSFNSSMDAFVIGNGTSSSRSNAFRIAFDGRVYGRSAYNSSGADYAEMFEWLDGNIDEEDRVGYFVTLDGDKIRKANSDDTYILGVISANPSVVGDASSEGWNGQYIRDEFSRVQYHYVDVEHEDLDENGETVTVIKNEYHPIYNPQYNPQAPYIPREDRKEWDAVGMMGKLLVRDDGTCEVNGYCSSNDDGIATNSETGYRVMKRVSDNIVQVLIK